ncbi:cyclase family protein [Desulfobulbus propionicus]
MLNWISLSLPIRETMAVYKNLAEKRPRIETTRNFRQHGMHESTLHLPLHTGTHVDYPLHAMDGGKCSSDYQRFPLEFTALVVDLCPEPPSAITLDLVQTLPMKSVDAVFFRTLEQPLKEFDPLFPGVTDEAAAWLCEYPLLFVGIDQLGIERAQPGHPTHIRLLEKDILIIEGLDLSHLADGGRYRCRALTLGIEGVEAEPVLIYARTLDAGGSQGA